MVYPYKRKSLGVTLNVQNNVLSKRVVVLQYIIRSQRNVFCSANRTKTKKQPIHYMLVATIHHFLSNSTSTVVTENFPLVCNLFLISLFVTFHSIILTSKMEWTLHVCSFWVVTNFLNGNKLNLVNVHVYINLHEAFKTFY